MVENRRRNWEVEEFPRKKTTVEDAEETCGTLSRETNLEVYTRPHYKSFEVGLTWFLTSKAGDSTPSLGTAGLACHGFYARNTSPNVLGPTKEYGPREVLMKEIKGWFDPRLCIDKEK